MDGIIIFLSVLHLITACALLVINQEELFELRWEGIIICGIVFFMFGPIFMAGRAVEMLLEKIIFPEDDL